MPYFPVIESNLTLQNVLPGFGTKAVYENERNATSFIVNLQTLLTVFHGLVMGLNI